MFEIGNSVAHTIAAAALLAAAAFAAPASAQSTTDTPTTPPAAIQPSTTQPAPGANAKRRPVDRVEARIAQLHQQLKITPEQQPQWDALAQAMRDNAHQMESLLQERAKTVQTANAVDDLKSYEALADAHAEGLKKFIPAFEALYVSMSDDQKKTADAVFRAHQHHGRTATKKS